MPQPFLEERLPIGVRAGASYSDTYNVEITQTAAGQEYRRLIHPYPVRVYSIFYTDVTANLWDSIMALYHRAYGMFAGFRVKALDDYSTNNRTGPPTAFDQVLKLVSAGIYQMQVGYGGNGTPISIGTPYRTIFKPVSGTVKIAIGAYEQLQYYTASISTGEITFNNEVRAISGISNAANAVITLGAHSANIGDSGHISGVSGMTGINGQRCAVIAKNATTVTVDIDSTGYSTYTSGGTINSAPQTGESVTGGCQFDIPCRFNSHIDVKALSPGVRETSEIEIIELLNP
jgi:uncharacterized protein (TIGR02217 family)